MTQAHGPAHMRIGALARDLGLNPKTIRFYEQIGLMPEPQRNAAGYRLYGAAARERLHFIAKAKTIGLTLQEIGEILALRDAGVEPRGHVQLLIARKLATVDEQLQRLSEHRRELLALQAEAVVTPCSGTPICGIIELHVRKEP
jgi:MerR family Zn(II)-responsive transcriptional regulator of zntA